MTRLVQYSYGHTMHYQRGSDKLRNLVSDYVVCHVRDMCGEAEFLDLLQRCNGLASDLLVKLIGKARIDWAMSWLNVSDVRSRIR